LLRDGVIAGNVAHGIFLIESRGFFCPETRTTSQASDKTIGVSGWHEKTVDVVKESRERVGDQQRKNKR
jgi:hypothetical protein